MSFSPAAILRSGRLPGAGSPLFRRLARGGFWSLAGDAGARAFSFASAIVVARLLGVTEFGAFALIQSTLVMLTTFAAFGMGHTSSRFIAAYRNTDPARAESINGVALRFSALTGLLVALSLFVAAPFVATTVLRAPELAGPLRLVAPVLFLSAISSAMGGAVAGFEAFSRLARIAWIASFGNFIAVVAGVSLWGLKGAVLGLVGSELARSSLVMWLARSILRENGMQLLGRARTADASVLWQFSLPLFLTAMLNAPVMWLCQTLIARQPGGMTQIGLYDAGQKWMTLVMLVPIAASAAFGPVLANLSEGSDASVHKRTTLSLAAVQLILTGIPAAIIALGAPWATYLFGAGFDAAAPVIVVTMMLAPIFVLKHLYWQALTSRGHAWASLALQVLWAVLAVSLTWVLRDGGAVSLAKAMLSAYAVTLVASIVLGEWIWRR